MIIIIITIIVGTLRTVTLELEKELQKNRDYPEKSIVSIGQNTPKSPGELKRLVSLTPLKEHELTLLRK